MTRLFFPTAPRRLVTCLAAVLMSASWVHAARAETSKVTPEASAHFAAGVSHLEGKAPDRYQHAYREFKAAYAASPTWKILGNLGIAAQGLERYGEASAAFDKYLAEGGKDIDAREAAQVRRDLERLRVQHATVIFDGGSTPFWILDTRVSDAGVPIVNQYGPFDGRAELQVHAGKHEFQIDRPGTTAPVWSVTLLPGDASTHSIALEESLASTPFGPPDTASDVTEDAGSSSHTLSYVLWGGGAAAAIAATVFYVNSNHLQTEADQDFARDCPQGVDEQNPQCTSTTAGDAKAANWGTAALVTGVGAAAALLGGTLIYFLNAGSSSDAGGKNQAKSDEASVRAWVSPTGIGLSGNF